MKTSKKKHPHTQRLVSSKATVTQKGRLVSEKVVVKQAFEIKKNALEIAPARLEAYPPQAVLLDGKDFIIRGCDGENVYIWIAQSVSWKGKDVYKVLEVYPGLSVKRTELRTAKEAKDLVFPGRFEDLSELLEELSEQLFADFEDGAEGVMGEEAEDAVEDFGKEPQV